MTARVSSERLREAASDEYAEPFPSVLRLSAAEQCDMARELLALRNEQSRAVNTGDMVQWVIDAACSTGLDWRVWVRRQKSDVAIGVCLYVMCKPRFEDTALGPLPVARIERAHEWGIEELEHVYDGPDHVLRQVRHIAAELTRAAR